MPEPKRAALLIEIFANDADARRAALCWSRVPPKLTGLRMLRAWAKCSGLDLSRVERVADVLRAHEICLPDRTLDAEAVPILEALAAEVLRKMRGRG
jgi:hypothetical protein